MEGICFSSKSFSRASFSTSCRYGSKLGGACSNGDTPTPNVDKPEPAQPRMAAAWLPHSCRMARRREEDIDDNNKLDNKSIITLSNINHIVEKEKIISSNKNYKKKYLGGITSYNKVVLLKNFTFNPNFDSLTIDRESLLESVINFLNNLDEDLTYSILFCASSSNDSNINHTISKSSMNNHKLF